MDAQSSSPQIHHFQEADRSGWVSLIASSGQLIHRLFSSVPTGSVPCDDAFQQVNHVVRKDAEQSFTFFGGGVTRIADVPPYGAVFGDPSSRGGFRNRAKPNRSEFRARNEEIPRNSAHY